MILDAFTSERPMSLGDLEIATGLFKSVIFRYMISLEGKNYIVKLHDGRYRLGPKLMELGNICESSFDFLSIVNPALDRIADETGETVSFYIREGNNRICIARRDSNHSLKVSVRPGQTKKLDETSTGLVLQHFSEISGYDVGEQELFRATSGVVDALTCSVCFPIFGASGVFKGGLTVSGPVGRFDTTDRRMRERVRLAAGDLALKLGFRPLTEKPRALKSRAA